MDNAGVDFKLVDVEQDVESLVETDVETDVESDVETDVETDVEELIGNRPFEEKTTLEVTEAESFAPSETTVDSAHADDMIDTANATIDAADAAGNNE